MLIHPQQIIKSQIHKALNLPNTIHKSHLSNFIQPFSKKQVMRVRLYPNQIFYILLLYQNLLFIKKRARKLINLLTRVKLS